MELKLALAAGAALGLAVLPACVAVDVDEAYIAQDVEYARGSVTNAGATLPFSKAVRVGQTIYLSGELGIDYDTGALVPGGTGPETTQIFANIANTLEQFDADLSDIVKCTVFLGDMSTFGEMNAAYTAALPDPKPARSTFGANGLALNAALEIECLAIQPR